MSVFHKSTGPGALDRGYPNIPKGEGRARFSTRDFLWETGKARGPVELVGNAAFVGETAGSPEACLWSAPLTGRRNGWGWFLTHLRAGRCRQRMSVFHKSTGSVAVARDTSISQEATVAPAFPQETSCGKADQREGLLSLWETRRLIGARPSARRAQAKGMCKAAQQSPQSGDERECANLEQPGRPAKRDDSPSKGR
ncbi:hypothetical protein C6Q02_14415 [Burkholderia multivorans]|nr:hypothetical protein C6Q02_14415 [Burkholderia multivorans]